MMDNKLKFSLLLWLLLFTNASADQSSSIFQFGECSIVFSEGMPIDLDLGIEETECFKREFKVVEKIAAATLFYVKGFYSRYDKLKHKHAECKIIESKVIIKKEAGFSIPKVLYEKNTDCAIQRVKDFEELEAMSSHILDLEDSNEGLKNLSNQIDVAIMILRDKYRYKELSRRSDRY